MSRGGGSGIGTDCARRFCAQGARVTISGRRLEKLQAVQTELGANCHIVQGDVTVQADREAMLSEAVKHGNDGLDALVNNAANMYRQPVDGYTETFLKEAFDTNVVSAMMLSSMAVPHLEKTQGSIVFIGSTHTRRAFPGASLLCHHQGRARGLNQGDGCGVGSKADPDRLHSAGRRVHRAESPCRLIYRRRSERPV